jgi:hypothetical protein
MYVNSSSSRDDDLKLMLIVLFGESSIKVSLFKKGGN